MAATRSDLEKALREIWQTAQDADGSRGGMSEALDFIQDACEEVFPDLGENDDDADDADGDGNTDDDEEDDDDN